LNLERVDEGSRHAKAGIDIDHSDVCSQRSQPRTPCERAKRAEMRRLELAMAELQRKDVDIRNQYEHEQSGCRDSDCYTRAGRSEGERRRSLDVECHDEQSRHSEALKAIERGTCGVSRP